MVRVAGVEPTTCGFGGRHSIQLSYTRSQTADRVGNHTIQKTAGQEKPNKLNRVNFARLLTVHATIDPVTNPSWFAARRDSS